MSPHVLITVVMLALSIAAFASAGWAMRRGLTYSAFAATTATLMILALAKAAHFFDESLGLGLEAAHVDHIIEIGAYGVFVWLTFRAGLIKGPSRPAS